jgi:hypothetical protein
MSDKKTAYLTRLYFDLLHKTERAINALNKQKDKINQNDYEIEIADLKAMYELNKKILLSYGYILKKG